MFSEDIKRYGIFTLPCICLFEQGLFPGVSYGKSTWSISLLALPRLFFVSYLILSDTFNKISIAFVCHLTIYVRSPVFFSTCAAVFFLI